MDVLVALLLLGTANGAPILTQDVLGPRGAWPLDAGLRAWDGRPLLGPAKTVRGVVAAILTTAPLAWLLGLPATVGAALGFWAMAGDALSSFVKRRLGIETSGQALFLDQVPESLLPALVLRSTLGLSGPEVAFTVLAFLVLELTLSRVLFRLRLRKRPY